MPIYYFISGKADLILETAFLISQLIYGCPHQLLQICLPLEKFQEDARTIKLKQTLKSISKDNGKKSVLFIYKHI